jgi:hypothetical protein
MTRAKIARGRVGGKGDGGRVEEGVSRFFAPPCQMLIGSDIRSAVPYLAALVDSQGAQHLRGLILFVCATSEVNLLS